MNRNLLTLSGIGFYRREFFSLFIGIHERKHQFKFWENRWKIFCSRMPIIHDEISRYNTNLQNYVRIGHILMFSVKITEIPLFLSVIILTNTLNHERIFIWKVYCLWQNINMTSHPAAHRCFFKLFARYPRKSHIRTPVPGVR